MAVVEIWHSGQIVDVFFPKYSVEATTRSYAIDVVTGLLGGGGIPYEYGYEVTPTAEGMVLPTRAKTMADDLTVHPIPYLETTNDSGGMTVSIAS